MREVPDDLVEVIEKTKDIFDEFYVVFTDYTGKEERKVTKERRDKDPILFGVFKNKTNVSDRFYFLGDWVDEYCDLTLDKMIAEYKEKTGNSPVNVTTIPANKDELISLLKSYEVNDTRVTDYSIPLNSINSTQYTSLESLTQNNKDKKTNFFDKVRSIFKSF